MTRYLPLLLAAFLATPVLAQTAPQAAPPGGLLTPAPKSDLDGNWKGTSDGGSCNAPLEIALAIEYGFVDGTAYDTSAKGPVPNQSKGAPPPATPGLWQVHGTAHKGESFTLVATASVRGHDKRDGKITLRRDGGSLVFSEDSGCRRTARLNR